jgi:hypothetical protein
MTALWQHQREGVELANQYPGYMLAHDMGTGKTCTAIEIANRMDAHRVLILCPKAVVSVWPHQFEIHSRKAFTVLPLDKGLVRKKAELAEALLKRQAARPSMRIALVINYESAWRAPLGGSYNRRGRLTGPGLLLGTDWDLVIADESHRIKSPNSRASWFAYQFTARRKAKKRLALTGTPMPHALSSDSPVLTPTGWTPIGEIKKGDCVIGSDGQPTEVIGVWPQGSKPLYSVRFSDGAWVKCTGDHLWQVRSRSRRSRGLPPFIMKTDELPNPLPIPNSNNKFRQDAIRGLFDKCGAARWHVPIVKPVEFKAQRVPIDPYLLGVLLGDGHLGHPIEFTTPDAQIVEEVGKVLPKGLQLTESDNHLNGCAKRYRITSGKKGGSLKGPRRGPKPNPVAVAIDRLGLRHHRSEDKFVPECYLWNSIENRLAILQGLCDTDGSSSGSTTRYTTTSKRLSEDVRFLVRSLGGHGRVSIEDPAEVSLPQGGTVIRKRLYVHLFRIPLNPFRLKRKRDRHELAWRKPRKNIVEIFSVEPDEAICITVAAKDGLYVTKDFIVTHNSPLDIYAQYRFLDPSIFKTNFHRFKMRYAKILDLGDFKKIIGFQNLPELHRLFYTRAHRVVKSDVLDLPPVVHVKSFCTLDKRAMKIYAMLKTAFVAWLDETGEQITAANILTKLLRLSQLTGGYFQADGAKYGVFIDKAKIKLLEDLLLSLPEKEPVVIFCRFRPEIEAIKKTGEALGRHCAELSGSMNQLQEWQKGQYDVIVVQIRSGGVGVDLTRACYGFYFSTGYSLGDFDQSLARLDRPGQTRKVTYHHLLAENTIDIDIYQSLEKKRDVVESVLKAVGRGGALQPYRKEARSA